MAGLNEGLKLISDALEVEVCQECKKPIKNHRGEKYYLKCQNGSNCNGDVVSLNCLVKHKVCNTKIQVPSEIIQRIGENADYCFSCYECLGKEIPLPIQLLRQGVVSWSELLDCYRTDAEILTACRLICQENRIDIPELEKRATATDNSQKKEGDHESEREVSSESDEEDSETEEKEVKNPVSSPKFSSSNNSDMMSIIQGMLAEFKESREYDRQKQKREDKIRRDKKERKRKEKQEQAKKDELRRLEEKEERQKLIDFLMSKSSESTATNSSSENRSKECRLPEMKLDCFSGSSLKEWGPWWDAFKTLVDSNSKLSTVKKFYYLKSYLTGEAKISIEGLPMVEENYEAAIEILHKRFGNTERLELEYISALENLSPVFSDKLHILQNFFNVFQVNFRGLLAFHKNDVETVNTRHPILLKKVFCKLPLNIRKEMMKDNEQCQKDWAIFHSMLEHMLSVLRDLEECSGILQPSSSVGNSTSQSKLNSQVKEYSKWPKSVVTSPNSNPKRNFNPPTMGMVNLAKDSSGNAQVKNSGGGGTSNSANSSSYSYTRTFPPSPQNSYNTVRTVSGNSSGVIIQTRQKSCYYCAPNSNHWSDMCTKYPSVKARKTRLSQLSKTGSFCTLCLSVQHKSDVCPLRGKKSCVYCKKNHHRSLCFEKFGQAKAVSANLVSDQCEQAANEENLTPSNSGNLTMVSQPALFVADIDRTYKDEKPVLMQFVKVLARNPKTGKSARINVMLDSGCKYSYIKGSTAKMLNLESKKSGKLNVGTFGTGELTSFDSRFLDIQIQLAEGNFLGISVYTIDKVSRHVTLDAVPLSPKDQEVVNKLCRHEQISEVPREIEVDLLLGQNYHNDIYLPNKPVYLEKSGAMLIASRLGWLPCGMFKEGEASGGADGVSLALFQDVRTVEFESGSCTDVEDLWKLEAIGISDHQNISDDLRAQQMFDETVSVKNGRIYASWPFKSTNPELPDNFNIAFYRLISLLKKLEKAPQVREKYIANFEDQLEKGVIEKVDETVSDSPLKHYIPHHAVVKPERTTSKVRIVFDASCKARKDLPSLNDILLRGPVILDDLCGLILRFRTKRVGILADIEKAFLQIGLYPADREVTRFLWLKNTEQWNLHDGNLQIYRFCRVPFGMISSPFLLAASVKWVLANNDSAVTQVVANSVYVDNLCCALDSEEEAVNFYFTLKQLFSQYKMNFREWASNSENFMGAIPECDRVSEQKVKVLGVSWDRKKDTFEIRIPPVEKLESCDTKRAILKCIASIFDPLGWLCCLVISAKILLQNLWKDGLEWDEKISEKRDLEWKSAVESLLKIREIQIPRLCVIPKGSSTYSLHCFCDASPEAFSAAVYLKVESGTDASINLLFAKARLVPKGGLSVPRAELLAAVIGVRCLKFVEKELKLPITKKYLWSDSCCVLHWIKSDRSLKVFVENRIQEIRSQENLEFRYVSGNDNPADLASKKVSLKKFSHDFWFHGPPWLLKESCDWPTWSQNFHESEVKEIEREYKKDSVCFVGGGHMGEQEKLKEEFLNSTVALQKSFDLRRFSSLKKLLRVTALVCRFLRKGKKRVGVPFEQVQKSLRDKKFDEIGDHIPSIEGEEILNSKLLWEKSVQIECFAEKLSDKNSKNFEFQLGLHFNKDDLLVCGGRIGKSGASEFTVCPKLLPKNHRFSNLVILDYHEKKYHAGVSQTLANLRNEYWVAHGRTVVRKVLASCCLCRKFKVKPYRYPLPTDLPKERVSAQAPFTNSGVDIFGPLYCNLKSKDKQAQKVWVVIFACMQIRAIYLELCLDVTGISVFYACRRFIANCGQPKLILSDNAKQFTLAKSLLANLGIRWVFIPVISPNVGGQYERLIGLVKAGLRKTLGKNTLSFEQLRTVMSEIQAVVNSRPLTYSSGDVNDPVAISPRDFLVLNPNKNIPVVEAEDPSDPNFEPKRLSTRAEILKSWKIGNHYLDLFWEDWKKQYLTYLREQHILDRKKAGKTCGEYTPSAGDVVLIKDKSLPRNVWKLARVTKLLPGRDNEIRTCLVKTANIPESVHSVKNLYPIELSEK